MNAKVILVLKNRGRLSWVSANLLFFVISYIFDQVVQQRATQLELDDQRRQVQELGQTKKHLEAEVADLKDRLELEVISKNEESSQSSLYLSL